MFHRSIIRSAFKLTTFFGDVYFSTAHSYQKNGRKHRKTRLLPGLCLQSERTAVYYSSPLIVVATLSELMIPMLLTTIRSLICFSLTKSITFTLA